MADQLSFDTKALHGSGQNLQDVGRRMNDHWQQMQGTVQGMGDIFGDDMVGSLIATTYQAAHQIAHDSYTSSAKGFNDFGDGLLTMAGTYDATERKNVENVGGVGKGL